MNELIPIGYLFLTVGIFLLAVSFVWFVMHSHIKVMKKLNNTLATSLSVDRKALKAEQLKIESLKKECEMFDEATKELITQIKGFREEARELTIAKATVQNELGRFISVFRKLYCYYGEGIDYVAEAKVTLGNNVRGELRHGGHQSGIVCAINKYGIRIKTDNGKTPYLIPETVELL